MSSIQYPETTKYVVAHNGNDVFHYKIIEPQNCFASGQPFLEIFDSEEEVKEAFPQLFPSTEQSTQDSFLKDPE